MGLQLSSDEFEHIGCLPFVALRVGWMARREADHPMIYCIGAEREPHVVTLWNRGRQLGRTQRADHGRSAKARQQLCV
jgi:hypothetical protein